MVLLGFKLQQIKKINIYRINISSKCKLQKFIKNLFDFPEYFFFVKGRKTYEESCVKFTNLGYK